MLDAEEIHRLEFTKPKAKAANVAETKDSRTPDTESWSSRAIMASAEQPCICTETHMCHHCWARRYLMGQLDLKAPET